MGPVIGLRLTTIGEAAEHLAGSAIVAGGFAGALPLAPSGAPANIGAADGELFRQLSEAWLTRTDESREIYTPWEGPESVNNVIDPWIGVD